MEMKIEKDAKEDAEMRSRQDKNARSISLIRKAAIAVDMPVFILFGISPSIVVETALSSYTAISRHEKEGKLLRR